MVEASDFCIYTDHKPVTFAYNLKPNQLSSPGQGRHLDYISQFTTCIRHVAGADNVVAKALSRFKDMETALDYQALTVAQQQDQELREFRRSTSSLRLREILLPGTNPLSPVTCPPKQRDHSSRSNSGGQLSTRSTACPTLVSTPL
jgi:hypothetical protein